MSDLLNTTNLGFTKFQSTVYGTGYGTGVFEALVTAGILPQGFQVIKGSANLSNVTISSTVALVNENGDDILIPEGKQILLLEGIFKDTFVTNNSPYGKVLYGLKTTPAATGESLTTVFNNARLNINPISLGTTLGIYDQNFAYSPTLGTEQGMVVAPSTVRTSINGGVTWINTSEISKYMYGAVWALELSLFVLTGDTDLGAGKYIMTSPDGVTWTYRTCTTGVYYSIAWNGTVFVAPNYNSTGNVLTSTDGETWTNNEAVLSNKRWLSVSWSSSLSLFVAVAYEVLTNNIATSPDGVEWTLRNNPDTGPMNYVLWIEELEIFVATGLNGKVITSRNGTTWTRQTTGLNSDLGGIAYGDGLILININTSGFISSVDGITWISQTYSPTLASYIDAYGIVYIPSTKTFLVEYPYRVVPLHNDTTAIISTSSLYETIGTNLGDSFTLNTILISSSSSYLCVEVQTLNTGTVSINGDVQIVLILA